MLFPLMKKSTELFFVVYQTEDHDFQLALSTKTNFILLSVLVPVALSVFQVLSG